jgi:hypothetical protein
MPFGLEVKKPSARVVLLEPDHSRRLAPSRTLYRREAKHPCFDPYGAGTPPWTAAGILALCQDYE